MTPQTSRTPAPPGAAGSRLGLVLAACCLGQFMNVLDASVVNVALPAIAEDLRFDRHDLYLVNNAYTVVVCGFLLLGGRLADLHGRRRIFLCGVALFTLASAVGGAADGPATLILARAFQGLGAAVMAPATLTVLAATFTQPAARGRAFGWWSAVSGAAGAIGVLAGGMITQWLSWRWILLVNVPIGIALFATVCWVVPQGRGPRREKHRLDIPGAVTVTLGLMGAVYAAAASHTYGWGSAAVLVPLIGGAVLLALFVLIQTRFARDPLVPLVIFRNRPVAAANTVAFFAIAALFSTFYFFTLLLQQVLGYSPLRTGLAYLPLSAGIALAGWGVSSLVPRCGPRPVLLAGLCVSCVGLLWLSRLDENATYAADVLGPVLLLGSGMGAVLNATTNAATAGLPAHQAGLGSGLLNATRQLGCATGLVALTALSSARIDAVVEPTSGAASPHALAAGYGLALTGAALLTAAALPAALLVSRRRRHGLVRGRSRASQGAEETLAS
ncbi:MFS transporter [Streptomyces sp. Edi4]|uniref:MFS transporter n=1 Tax=Streptomyces sp. Edi4 TaxID=3162527 RepID=UPI003305F799